MKNWILLESLPLRQRFVRRFDRWLMLRAPMLWRTRLPYCLLILCLIVLAAVAFVQTNMALPIDLQGGLRSLWWFEVLIATIVILLWLSFILRRSVGEVLPTRHAATVL